MAMMIIEEECIACSACAAECINGAIYAQGMTFVIDTRLCTSCKGVKDGPLCISVCPNSDAIVEISNGDSLGRAGKRSLAFLA